MSAKLKKIMRREVVTLSEGRRLGRPHDLLIDPEQHRIAVLVLSSGSVPDTSVIVRGSAVRSFESDTLAVESLDTLTIAACDEEILRLLNQGLRFRGRPLLGGGGRKLGRIVNVLVDERGSVTEYRVRKGILGFLRPATKIAPADLRTSGGEVAVLREPEGNPGGDARPEGP